MLSTSWQAPDPGRHGHEVTTSISDLGDVGPSNATVAGGEAVGLGGFIPGQLQVPGGWSLPPMGLAADRVHAAQTGVAIAVS